LASFDSVVETVPRARPDLSATCPAVIASPPASAASTEALVAPGAVRRVERAAGGRVRRAGALVAASASGLAVAALAAVRAGAFRAAGLRAGRGRGAGVEGGERFAQPVGLADELVKALLDLFTQAVDHLSHILRVGAERAIVHKGRGRASTQVSMHFGDSVGERLQRA